MPSVWAAVDDNGGVYVKTTKPGNNQDFPRNGALVTITYGQRARSAPAGTVCTRTTSTFVLGGAPMECRGLEQGLRQLSKGETAKLYVASRLAAAECETLYEVQLGDVDSPPSLSAMATLPLPQREEILSAFYAKFDASKTLAEVKEIVEKRKDKPFTQLLSSLQKKYKQSMEEIVVLWRVAQTQPTTPTSSGGLGGFSAASPASEGSAFRASREMGQGGDAGPSGGFMFGAKAASGAAVGFAACAGLSKEQALEMFGKDAAVAEREAFLSRPQAVPLGQNVPAAGPTEEWTGASGSVHLVSPVKSGPPKKAAGPQHSAEEPEEEHMDPVLERLEAESAAELEAKTAELQALQSKAKAKASALSELKQTLQTAETELKLKLQAAEQQAVKAKRCAQLQEQVDALDARHKSLAARIVATHWRYRAARRRQAQEESTRADRTSAAANRSQVVAAELSADEIAGQRRERVRAALAGRAGWDATRHAERRADSEAGAARTDKHAERHLRQQGGGGGGGGGVGGLLPAGSPSGLTNRSATIGRGAAGAAKYDWRDKAWKGAGGLDKTDGYDDVASSLRELERLLGPAGSNGARTEWRPASDFARAADVLVVAAAGPGGQRAVERAGGAAVLLQVRERDTAFRCPLAVFHRLSLSSRRLSLPFTAVLLQVIKLGLEADRPHRAAKRLWLLCGLCEKTDRAVSQPPLWSPPASRAADGQVGPRVLEAAGFTSAEAELMLSCAGRGAAEEDDGEEEEEEEEEKFTGLQLPATPSLKQREQDAIGAPGPPPLWTVLLFCLSAIKHRTDPSH